MFFVQYYCPICPIRRILFRSIVRLRTFADEIFFETFYYSFYLAEYFVMNVQRNASDNNLVFFNINCLLLGNILYPLYFMSSDSFLFRDNFIFLLIETCLYSICTINNIIIIIIIIIIVLLIVHLSYRHVIYNILDAFVFNDIAGVSSHIAFIRKYSSTYRVTLYPYMVHYCIYP